MDTEKGAKIDTAAEPEDLKAFPDEVPDYDAQRGVQQIEATTLTWSKWSLAALLINIWLIFLTNGFRGSILAGLVPYVTSDFRSHSLMTVIDIVSRAITASVYIPIAKLLDVWGRAEGFALMVGSATLGVVLMATSQNLATFCAAQVFYSIGFSGVIYTVAVLAADVTSLRNRGIAFAFTSSPYMITAFAGSKAAESFLLYVRNWRWGFGSFAIIVPAVCTPLFVLLKLQLRKAEKRGLIAEQIRKSWSLDRIWNAIVAFDCKYSIVSPISQLTSMPAVPGVVLFAGGLTIFLLPFNLATHAPNGWKTDYIIAMIIVGFLLLIAFGLYETYIAKQPFLKNKFLLDRSVIGACLIDMTYQISYYCWASYFTSFLQVVCNLSIAEAGYVNSTFQVVSGVLLFIVGYLIRRTGRFKWLFYVTVPIYTLGLGLMIAFRRPNQHIGYIIMCEILISIGGSVFILLVQLACLAAVDHQHVAAVLALLYVSGSVGGAIGSTISGTIWTNTFAKALGMYLPESAQPQLLTIYSSLPAQLAYPVGSPERIAIQMAYGYGQARMLAAGVGVFGLSFGWMFLIRNQNVSKNGQTKGMVF
ncbi:putative siderophore-dependent iron transporter [Boeremia exigua]|uniref:putative siderophore-dependent iron transporter n=1 Tax=Boeremia exigua TaxID=749465 RepID=UPI001E8E608C|nr:putative siderophore-dependent iron transporter [Boeremia exigua]KAH6629852.1 putative siderophore-dependent iron transporter [Boeremia exigua]